jgi:hypothetical protein
MGHYCGAPNTTKPGTCGRWLVNYDHCRDHRGNRIGPENGRHDPPGETPPNTAATLLANIFVDGLDAALSDLVVEYLGKREAGRLRRRRRARGNCQPLADAAKAVLDLRDKTHEVVGKAVGDLLPPDTPDFAREVTSKVAEKIPLPWDAKFEAIARGLQVIGIFMCMVQGLAPAQCACLIMMVSAASEELIKEKVGDLVARAREDLAGGTVKAA